MKIKILPDLVINQIAAGEVVDRPSSVVRELVDNAVDAGALDISVYLEHGGHSGIRVIDDGFGMARDDALLAFERHATSKLRSADDLQQISSLGFRGEALPSIAAVSKVRLTTRQTSAEVGTQVIMEGGVLKTVQTVASNPGTDIHVHRLFFNTPARRKFLKQPKTEEQRTKQWLISSSLARPQIRYRLYNDDREILNLPRKSSLMDRAKGSFHGTMVDFDHESTFEDASRGSYLARVCGLVGHPAMASADSQQFIILVNGRLVSDKLILRAVKEGFSSTLKDREFPTGFVSLAIPAWMVDVNVHPQKAEVRFSQPQMIFNLVREAVQTSMSDFTQPMPYTLIQRNQTSRPAFDTFANQQPIDWSSAGTRSVSIPAAPGPVASWSRTPEETGDVIREEKSAYQSPNAASHHTGFRFSDLRYIGQALACYLFCEHQDGLYVVDMHAAHERYNYNLFRNGFREKQRLSQELLVPISLELGESGVANCLLHSQVFERFGFRWEAFGPTTLLVRSLPVELLNRNIEALIKDVAAIELKDSAHGRFEEELDHIAARLACHASIRSGHMMSKEEVYALFAALDSSEFSAACPHGRPVIVSFSASDIEKWFGRDR